MTRRAIFATLGAAVLVVAAAALLLGRRPPQLAEHTVAPATGPRGEPNPGGFVASDVARLAATGRPQLVEVFHYG